MAGLGGLVKMAPNGLTWIWVKVSQKISPAPQKVSHAKMTNWAGLNEVSQTILTNFVSISKS